MNRTRKEPAPKSWSAVIPNMPLGSGVETPNPSSLESDIGELRTKIKLLDTTMREGEFTTDTHYCTLLLNMISDLTEIVAKASDYNDFTGVI